MTPTARAFNPVSVLVSCPKIINPIYRLTKLCLPVCVFSMVHIDNLIVFIFRKKSIRLFWEMALTNSNQKIHLASNELKKSLIVLSHCFKWECQLTKSSRECLALGLPHSSLSCTWCWWPWAYGCGNILIFTPFPMTTLFSFKHFSNRNCSGLEMANRSIHWRKVFVWNTIVLHIILCIRDI